MLGGWSLLIDHLGDDVGGDNGIIFGSFLGGFSDFAYGTQHIN